MRRSHSTSSSRLHHFERLEPRCLLAAQPVINEFMAKNDSALRDGDGNFSDWIEIHNQGDAPIDVAGWSLTDDHTDPHKWKFPSGRPDLTRLEPDGYLMVFASGVVTGDNGRPASSYIDRGGHLHTNFRLNAEGEYLALVGPQGVVSAFGTPDSSYPAQYADISYGRNQQAGMGSAYFPESTPAARNGAGLAGVTTETVHFSLAGQTFRSPLQLQLSAEVGTIRYTLDGSIPSETSTAYTGPISIATTMQVRARVFAPRQAPGPVRSESFMELAKDVEDFQSPLPIVIIENFGAGPIPNKRAHNPPAGDGGGIQQVERQFAQLTIFETDGGSSELHGTPDLTTRSGIRVRGSSSANFRKQSLTVEAWGESNDDADIRPLGLPPESDWVLYAPSPEFDHTLLHNTFAYELSRQVGRYAARFQFVEVFLNTDGSPLSSDDHAGVYVFMEKIKRDPERVDVERLSADGSTGGWLLQSNRMRPIPVGGTDHPPSFHTKGPNRELQGPYGRTFTGGTDRGGDDIPTGYNTFLNFESPRAEEINQEQMDTIVTWFDNFEEALYGPEFSDPERGYRAFIDVDSFIDHMHLTNLTLSFDALQLSTYMFRRSAGHKMELGPIWDFDRAYGADSRAPSPSENLTYGRQFLWMPRLFEDPDYVQAFQDRWQELRDGPFAVANLHAIIDRQAAEITEEVAAANGTRNWPSRLQSMKDWLSARVAAIDKLYLPRPRLSASAAVVAANAEAEVSSLRGTIYYTTDGSDPRTTGGQIAPQAIAAAGGARDVMVLVPHNAPASAIVPDQAFHEQFGASWTGQDDAFDDSLAAGWKQGRMGIGFDERDTYLPLLDLDLLNEMADVNSSLYTRIEFAIAGEVPAFDVLTLRMRYDDGFVAYLNGVEIARANAPGEVTWNSRAAVAHRDSLAQEFEGFDVSSHLGLLRSGQNVLAIHGLNRRAGDNDMLVQAELHASQLTRTAIPVNRPIVVVARAFEDGDWSGPVQHRYLVLEADFNGDRVLDTLDVDVLFSEIRQATHALPFDLTGDRRVNRNDADELVLNLLGTHYGDANLDGRFDRLDIQKVLAAGKYATSDMAGFAEGDWDGNGVFSADDIVFVLAAGRFEP